MKSIKNYGLALLAMMVMLTAANAQSRYKHVPRVKVGKNNTEKVSVKEKKGDVTTTAAYMNAEETNTVANVTPVVTETENTTVASVTEDVVVVNHKVNNVVKHNNVVKSNQKADKDSFTNKVKNNSKLMEVKDVKKTAMAKWVLYMIICLIAAVVFTILAVVLAFTYVFVLVYIFWALAGLAWIGAIVFLILGLAGIM